MKTTRGIAASVLWLHAVTAMPLLRALTTTAALLSLTGCFIRLPMRGTPEQRGHIGSTVLTKQNLSIFTLGDGRIAIDATRENADVGPSQRKLAALPKGTPLVIRGLVHRRCPWGVLDYYVCRSSSPQLTFDLRTEQADQFVIWTPQKSRPGTAVPDEASAIQIAVAAWQPIYGVDHIAREKPYHATLRNGTWTVQGSLPRPNTLGGVALAEIRQTDGRVLRVIHGK